LEFDRDLVDVYPGDIRQNPDLYTNIGVGWAGIIKSTTAVENPDGTIHALTTFEHHYYDWQPETSLGGSQVSVSARGEGLFSTEAVFRRNGPDASLAAVETFAKPGSLAIVYGVPEKIEDGTIILKYRFLRVIPPGSYSISQFDYGRFGEPIRYLDAPPAAPKS
jgi:hypothetical protein